MLQTQRDSAAVQSESAEVQQKMADVTSQIAELTETAAKDSASISAITILSAVYVPGSFVGVSPGMVRLCPLAMSYSIRPFLVQISSNSETVATYK